jgi:cation transport protein ChaC
MALWVFGYGSLLWNPGFTPVETMRADLPGYHRSFCMLSIHHRGTVAEPGLVLALDAREGAYCAGVAFRVADAEEDAVLRDLRDRELISSAYVEEHVDLRLADGREITALAYVIERDHVQYCQFTLEEQAHRIAHAVGGRGPNIDYLLNTARHLEELGIKDEEMTWLVSRVMDIRAGETA